MVALRHLDGRLECDPFDRFCVGNPMAEPETPPQGDLSRSAPAWRPGDARPDVESMLRVDQAGEYGATRIYAGQLAVLGDRDPARPPDRADGGAGAAPPQAFRRTARRARRPPDPAPAVLADRRPCARRHHRPDEPAGGDGLHRRGRGRDRSSIIPSSSPRSATDEPALSAAIAEFQADEREHRDSCDTGRRRGKLRLSLIVFHDPGWLSYCDRAFEEDLSHARCPPDPDRRPDGGARHGPAAGRAGSGSGRRRAAGIGRRRHAEPRSPRQPADHLWRRSLPGEHQRRDHRLRAAAGG